MRLISTIIFISVFIFPSIIFAQNPIEEAQKVLSEKGEVCIAFEASREQTIAIGRIISIDHGIHAKVHAVANAKGFKKFLELKIPFEVLPAENKSNIEMAKSIAEVKEWNVYPTYSQYVQVMNDYATNYPGLCELVSIGTSINGKELLFLKITDNPDTKEAEPEVMYTSTMHGDETAGYPTMLHLIEYLLENYQTDDRVQSLVNNLEIWINPLFNPDGTYRGGDHTVSGSIRANANYVDLNRNFPSPTGLAHPDGEEYQKETVHMMDFMNAHNFILLANFHGGTEVINYPWDYFSARHVDDDWYQMVSQEWADNCQAVSTGYMTGYDDGITNGYDWYQVDGGRQDWANVIGGREITVEISDTKTISGSQLPTIWNYNKEALLAYLEHALYGINGVVTDLYSGDPVAAKIEVLGHDNQYAYVYSDENQGRYIRMIKGGSYNLKFSADNYYDKTINNVMVSDFQKTELNVELEPITTSTNREQMKHRISLAPNPSDGNMVIKGTNNENFILTIKNTEGIQVHRQVFSAQKEATQIDLSFIPNGMYICQFSTSKSISSFQKLVISH